MIRSGTVVFILFGVLSICFSKTNEKGQFNLADPYIPLVLTDTVPILKDRFGSFADESDKNPFDLRDPSIVDREIEYDPETGDYFISEKIGDDYFRMPSYMSFDEYLDWKAKEQERIYFQRLSGVLSAGGEVGSDVDPIKKFDISSSLIDRLFGGSTVDLDPKGNIDLTFGFDHQNVQNPVLLERQQRNGGFDFDMAIRMNMDGQIGEKLKLNANYNTQATFDFDRQLKLQYDSEAFSEDEILKKVEAGNVSLPLKSSLIQGSQSLFGLKTDMQFGRLRLTTVLSQQNSEQKNISIEQGAQLQEFLIGSEEYDENRHFFLSHYNRELFEPSLSNLPQISSLFKVSKIEVWVTNERRETENTRNIVALADLGEYDRITNSNPDFQTPNMPINPDISSRRELPDNTSNTIYRALLDDPMVRDVVTSASTLKSSSFQFVSSRDFEKVRARKLRQSEYTLHPELGFLSINTSLQPDQVLAVSYEYTYNGKKFQVGELSTDFPSETEDESVLFVKMLKSTTQRVDVPAWDLMMKNVYSIQAFQVSREDFYLDIFYEDPGKGEKRFLPTGSLASRPLLSIFNLDNLNEVGDPQPDGAFDFVPGITIFLNTGKIMFPILEPFGSSLASQFADPAEAEAYTFPQLYDSTITTAREYPDLNRFTIKARFKSSVSNEYSLGAFNVPEGSVRVTAGGQLLVEGQDYDVDYNLGKVRIINEAYINSSIPISVSFEDNALFSFNRKTMLGLRADYEVSKHLNVGLTYLHLFERPYTEKVNIGEDPINNKIIGLDLNYSKEAPWLTRIVDGIPLIDTKEKSNITFSAEGAVLKPGHSKAINQGDDKSGSLYIDDFEGSSIGIDLRTPTTEWVLASVPQNDNLNNNPKFPEATLNNDVRSGVNRARINWYRIETNVRTDEDRRDPYAQRIDQNDVFPNRSRQFGINNNIQTFDVTFNPSERGPYNFDVPGGTAYSAGLDVEGRLRDPETRWGGIMRDLRNTDFEAANIEYIEFWLLNPYQTRGDGTQLADNGKLFLNLGNISEDILRDSRLSYENGLPTVQSAAPVDTTGWGRIPVVEDITGSFSIDEQERIAQDIGYDGLNDSLEREFHDEYLQAIQSLNNEARQSIEADPSNDNFRHYRDYPEEDGVFTRYARFNNLEGNSKASTGNRLESSTNFPDKEDLNDDNTLNESEAYYQYEIPIEPDGIGGVAVNEFITDTLRSAASGNLWYRYQIPVEQYRSIVGSIQDFRSIRFIRMYMTDFEDQVTLRFAKFDLVRNQWRKYSRNLNAAGIAEPDNTRGNLEFDISAVNIEENSEKFPFNYVLPRGIKRERAVGTYANLLRNEQSLALNICNLSDGNAAAIYKILNEDFRNYERLKMFVHAEAKQEDQIRDGSLSLFVRMGSDYTRNYYEYEIPLAMSDLEISPESFRDPDEIWKEANEVDFPLELFRVAKIARNNTGAPLSAPYEMTDPENVNNRVRIIGNPNIGLVKGIMIGVRNKADDGLDHCTEVWINELRLNGLNEKGGAAALARLDFQLADFGRLSFSGNYSSIGWGALDQKLAQRSLEEMVQYDVAANLELGKFFGERSGLRIPFYAQYSATIYNPQYDPYDLDIELKDKLKEAPDKTTRDSLRDQAVDFTSIKSFNFTNVRKERTSTKQRTPKPWDIENFSLTYAQSEIKRHDPIIENDQTDEYRGALDYSFSTKPLYIQPLKNIKKDKLIKFLTQFNFNLIPNSFSFNTALNRQKTTKSYRFSDPLFKTWYTKRFTWDRNYNLNWDLTKSLKLRFNAINQSVIDEMNERDPGFDQQLAKDSIWSNLRNFGRTKNYSHNINVSYNLPFQHFPLLDFAQVRAQFNTTYGWSAAALNVDSLGNVIQNTQTRQISGELNFEKLYNKIPYLEKINQGSRQNTRSGSNTNRQLPSRSDQQGDQGQEKKDARDPGAIERLFIRPLMSLRKAKLQYSENVGSVIPGFTPGTRFFGMDRDWDAPGTEFILGFQPDDAWFDEAVLPENDWITDNIFLNQEVLLNNTKKWNASLSVEPFRDFRIEVNWDYSFTENHSEFFKKTDPNGPFQRTAPREVGSFNISYFTLGTLFEQDIEGLFDQFGETRKIISQRIGESGSVHAFDGEEYTAGFGKYQRDVLIPAFIASYADISPQSVDLNVFDLAPKPNWQLTYNGLSKIAIFKDVFSSVSLSHGYRSNLSVNSYNTDFDYLPSDPVVNTNEVTGDFYSRYEIPAIMITEQFSPLLGLNIKTRNDISLRVDMNKTRNLTLSFTDYQLNESKRTDYVIGFGYRIKNVSIPFLQPKQNKRSRSRRDQQQEQEENQDPNAPGGTDKARKGNDMEINFDFSFSDNVSLIHKFDTDLEAQASRGTKQLRISPSIDYDVTESLTLRFFFDYNKTTPYTSRSYPITNINSGITVRFTLQ
ncbi:MAG: cell surface protein SprA [Saprospiraceae bacterium]|nr:cell surface protein SprA [Saprospiraceae bacterium]